MRFYLSVQPLVLSLNWHDVQGIRPCLSAAFCSSGLSVMCAGGMRPLSSLPTFWASWSHYDNLLWLRMMPFSMGHNSFKSKPVFTSSAGELKRSARDPPCWISPADTRSRRLLFLLYEFLLTRPAFIFHEYAPIFILDLFWLGSSRAFITCPALSTGVLIYTKLGLCTVPFWINAFF